MEMQTYEQFKFYKDGKCKVIDKLFYYIALHVNGGRFIHQSFSAFSTKDIGRWFLFVYTETKLKMVIKTLSFVILMLLQQKL